MYKYLILIALHERLPITRMVFEHLKGLQKEFDFMVFGICSTREEAELCHEYYFDYCIEENYPLGRKMNRGLLEAMKFDFEYLMQLGSDDLITRELFEIYDSLDLDYFGVNTYHAVDIEGRRAKKFTYGGKWNPIWHPIGAGRVFKKEVLEKVLLHEDLWEDKAQKLLDNKSDMVMLGQGYRAKIVKHNGVGIIDIKSDTNIWSYDELGDCEAVPFETVEEHLCTLAN